MNPPRRLRGVFGMCNLREGFVILREGFEEAPWRLREAFSKTRSAKASRSPLEGFAKASRRRHERLHLETIRQIMTSPRYLRRKWLHASVTLLFITKKPDFEGQSVIKTSSYLLPFVLEAHRESLPRSCETSARRLSAESAEVYSTADHPASAAHAFPSHRAHK